MQLSQPNLHLCALLGGQVNFFPRKVLLGNGAVDASKGNSRYPLELDLRTCVGKRRVSGRNLEFGTLAKQRTASLTECYNCLVAYCVLSACLLCCPLHLKAIIGMYCLSRNLNACMRISAASPCM